MKTQEEGRCYIDHLAAEHRHVDQLLHQALQMFPSWEELDLADWLLRITDQFRKVRNSLAHHFQQEEEGGCLEEAVARAPGLAAEAEVLTGEHARLLKRLDDLVRKAETAPQVLAARQALEREFRDTVAAIHRHEEAENHIIERGFNVSLQHDE